MDFIDIGIIDIIDITLVAVIIWQVYRLLKGTAAMTIFLGIVLLYAVWVIVRIMHMELMSSIMSQVLGVGALALIVVFQQEIRHYLLMIGSRLSQTSNNFIRNLFSQKNSTFKESSLTEIVSAVMNMSNSKTGALIVFQRTSDLSTITETGDYINADISSRLIETIFFKNTPLHDGAMIINGDKIKYARCVLPVSDNLTIPAHLGLRHRAAVGVTEQTDALALVVSEQTGKVAIMDKGNIKILVAGDNLSEILSKKMSL